MGSATATATRTAGESIVGQVFRIVHPFARLIVACAEFVVELLQFAFALETLHSIA